MISGLNVTVEPRVRNARDGFGNDVEAYGVPGTVANVVVQPGACEDFDETRPEGVRVAYTLHFPKTFTGDLRGARVTLPEPYAWGNPYHVVGVPSPYMDANCPTDWHMPAEVEAVDG